ncbi:helicase [Pseudomonas floridensis]|uniref:Helicase n=1 Tax=Pseudomonas floridensis TaxID=1958950 RepID=A0A1X0N173_9PSED|nr:cysteine-rich CWC family protein [Pseudomonas floridensis]ORC57077.1 helicase [Pseudomonas floridensis]
MANPTPDTSLCPVCGFSNQCSLADPRTAAQPCWCFSESIDPTVLEALPDSLRNQACLCARCAGVARPAPGQPER